MMARKIQRWLTDSVTYKSFWRSPCSRRNGYFLVSFSFEGSLLDICVVSKPTRCVECFVYLKNVRSNSVVLSFEFSTSHWLSPSAVMITRLPPWASEKRFNAGPPKSRQESVGPCGGITMHGAVYVKHLPASAPTVHFRSRADSCGLAVWKEPPTESDFTLSEC